MVKVGKCFLYLGEYAAKGRKLYFDGKVFRLYLFTEIPVLYNLELGKMFANGKRYS